MLFSVIDSVALQLGPIQIHWYGLIIGSGIFLALYIALREVKRLGLNPDHYIDVVLVGVPVAVIFARIYYVAFQWDYYGQNPGEIFAIWQGGLAIHGALIGTILTGYIYVRMKKISFWNMGDIAAPSILLGQAIGRWGNFINQEAHGGPITEETQWIINILPNWIAEQMNIGGTYYHPTFLYESLWSIAGVLLIIFVLRYQTWIRRGEIFLSYLLWYSVGRFFIEGMRTDSLMITESLRTAQVISIVLILLSVFALWYRRKYGYADEKYGVE
ncbi:prolipoprotein diacylglyceryl transferase [Desulfuribacillus stibiiarsenatis]|uniref:Phosphatidylglycerol--prolipoprotein diacylglyceryl transferase n=1 Tax=Desulfuribacillus stibiiarsenatis TaxID=1390249 RepID=A0A1E5L9U2_9FIRM|nr:prolipoprotein diacylglyceryl transferase [Desulfuribacillus stibiiarsenatis]OEH86804.1 prolipoprotein diacylglyceryl transferase [Desulfuribacillus stibiiarsenatis]